MAKIGFIGIGNMGYAMLKGALTKYKATELIFSDVNEARMLEVSKETGVPYAFSNAECANRARFIVLAVKPQFYPSVLKNIKNIIREDQVVISIAAGITREDIKNIIGNSARVVRAMPNTPALVGEGMTGVVYDDAEFTIAEKDFMEEFFSSFGKMKKVDEKMLGVVTCVSGSAPAYVAMFVEALADSAVKHGMPRSDAYEFSIQMVLGTAKLLAESGEHPAVLKDKVCTPGGCTIAGVEALEEFGFRRAIMKATDACYEKT